jgi:predicted metal-dependent hydrolase
VTIAVVRSARARRLRLAVDPRSGEVRLTLPTRMPLRQGLAWAEEQRAWIERQQAKLPEGRPFVPGARVPWGDGELEIIWPAGTARAPRIAGSELHCGGPLDGLARRVERKLKAAALELLSAETAEYAALAGVTVSAVSIGDPRARWGSCAASGAIRYSWRLAMAPAFVRRATVAHEVAHRVHMNHGPAFHALVEQLFGTDPAPARAWLRTHGAALHWIGR